MNKLLTAIFCAAAGIINAADLDLTWDASPSSSIAGYHIYYGTTPNSTENKIVNVGPATTATVTGLLDNTQYYFTATAYFESGYSNQIVWPSTSVPDKLRYYPAAGFESRMTGGIFEGTNGDPVSGPYTLIYTIPTKPLLAWTEVEVPLGGFRYLRYRGKDATLTYCNVAEIEFYRNGVKLTGIGFGTGAYANNSNNAFPKALDGDVTTAFAANTPASGFVGIDTQ